MPPGFAHVNLIALDWRRLAAFYQDVFGCLPLAPERDLCGDWLDKATRLENAHIRGAHLRLPGFGDSGPTLEIFSYDAMPEHPEIKANTPGFAHIAFSVDDVAATAGLIMAKGGAPAGELVERNIPGAGFLTFQYLSDPEGNMIEIQNWRAV